MKHSWVLYLFLILLAGILVRNAPGSVALMLAGGTTGANLFTALEGPATSNKGTFTFGGNKVTLG